MKNTPLTNAFKEIEDVDLDQPLAAAMVFCSFNDIVVNPKRDARLMNLSESQNVFVDPTLNAHQARIGHANNPIARRVVGPGLAFENSEAAITFRIPAFDYIPQELIVHSCQVRDVAQREYWRCRCRPLVQNLRGGDCVVDDSFWRIASGVRGAKELRAPESHLL